MTKTKSTPSVEEEITTLDREIARLESELAEQGTTPLSWDEVTASTADELAAQEQRRGILPRLITAAEIRRLELQIKRERLAAEPLQAEREAAYKKLERAEAKLLKAQEERQSARDEWGLAHGALERSEFRIKRLEREVRELREGA